MVNQNDRSLMRVQSRKGEMIIETNEPYYPPRSMKNRSCRFRPKQKFQKVKSQIKGWQPEKPLPSFFSYFCAFQNSPIA